MNTLNKTERPLNESVVLITGALTGIGRATAFAFAAEGAKVVVSGRNADKGNALAAELQQAGAKAVFIQADVRHDVEVAALIDGTVAQFGRLDIAVNNAGTEGERGFIVDQTEDSYKATFDTNVLGTLLSLKHELRVMLAQGHGSVVNISSTFGKRAAPGASAYVASKHAVEGLTKTAALEGAAHGVRVNAVAPGPTATGMLSRFTGNEENLAKMGDTNPMKRIGRPDEVAQAILFIGSDKSPFLNGQVLAVDGGKMAVDGGSK